MQRLGAHFREEHMKRSHLMTLLLVTVVLASVGCAGRVKPQDAPTPPAPPPSSQQLVS